MSSPCSSWLTFSPPCLVQCACVRGGVRQPPPQCASRLYPTCFLDVPEYLEGLRPRPPAPSSVAPFWTPLRSYTRQRILLRKNSYEHSNANPKTAQFTESYEPT